MPMNSTISLSELEMTIFIRFFPFHSSQAYTAAPVYQYSQENPRRESPTLAVSFAPRLRAIATLFLPTPISF